MQKKDLIIKFLVRVLITAVIITLIGGAIPFLIDAIDTTRTINFDEIIANAIVCGIAYLIVIITLTRKHDFLIIVLVLGVMLITSVIIRLHS